MIKRLLILSLLLSGLIFINISCTSITQLFPKQPRPFQKKEFNSEEWKKGDYQTRGEMTNRDSTDNNLIGRIYKIEGNNTQEQILELLGKPDEKTRAACCYAGRAGKSGEVDLWLYYIEVEERTSASNQTEKSLGKRALKIYFDGNRVQPAIGERDGDHSFFPKIG